MSISVVVEILTHILGSAVFLGQNYSHVLLYELITACTVNSICFRVTLIHTILGTQVINTSVFFFFIVLKLF